MLDRPVQPKPSHNSFKSAVNLYLDSPRRERLIFRLTDWANQRREYQAKIGEGRIGFDCLTDETLDRLASRIAHDERSRRNRNRENYARNRQSLMQAGE